MAEDIDGYGFALSGSGHTLSGNVANGNTRGDYGGPGFLIRAGTNLVLSGNAALGNGGGGIYAEVSATITQNNLYGNDAPNCGLVNASGGTINATNNFWGAASGPGPDPADDVCNLGSSTTTVEPFATKEFIIK